MLIFLVDYNDNDNNGIYIDNDSNNFNHMIILNVDAVIIITFRLFVFIFFYVYNSLKICLFAVPVLLTDTKLVFAVSSLRYKNKRTYN